MSATLVEARGLTKLFPVYRAFSRTQVGVVRAVEDVHLDIARGETLGLVGESGCGKTTVARLLVRLIEPTSGSVVLFTDGQRLEVTALGKRALWSARRKMQMVFQDPYSSLNPRMTVRDIIEEPLVCYGVGSRRDRLDRVVQLLQVVGLEKGMMSRFPHALSGGERQRVAIARALALEPEFVIADEPVSALDVSIQAQILNLLQELQERFAMTYLIISHDLGVVGRMCDRVAVMYAGRVVECARTAELFQSPKHPYTEALLSAVPRADPRYRPDRVVLTGEVADPKRKPSGCVFHPRCRYAKDVCTQEEPPMKSVPGSSARVACHFAGDLALRGVAVRRPDAS